MPANIPEIMNRQLPLSIHLNDEATLEDFCWHGNHFLQQTLLATLEQTGERLIYLWGNTGSGKSHLLQACCHATNQTQSAIYLPLAMLKEWGPQIIDGIDEQDFISIDDLDSIAGLRDWEEALFHLYNRVRDNGRTTLIIAGKQPPANLSIALPDLKSRLGWGLVLQVHELEDHDKIHTLQLLARKRGFIIPTPVGQFLINRSARNMHDLQQILNLLDNASLAAKRKITIPFVKATLGL